MAQESSYSSDDIDILKGLEGVQARPAMYIGSTDAKGLHHLVYEVVDNSIDEALAGYCDDISVTIHEDSSVSVTDNGRGIPVDTHAEENRPAVEVLMTSLHAGGKFDNKAYSVSGGLHGVGVSVVNALSERLEVEIKRDGALWTETFIDSKPETPGDIERIRDLEPNEDTGTTVRFWPRTEMFSHVNDDGETVPYEFAFSTLRDRVQQLAFLNPGVNITLRDERPDHIAEEDEDGEPLEAREATFQYDGGIAEYVEYLNEGRSALHGEVIHFDGEGTGPDGKVEVEVAMQVTEDVQASIHSFANNINTKEGGEHLTGFRSALTRIVNSYANDHDMLGPIDGNLKGDDIREGMTAVISIKHPDPQFEGQTKTKLGNSEVRGIVTSTVHDGLGVYFDENPDTAESIIERAVQAAKARQAAKKAEEVTRRDNPLETTSLPGKLSDCQTRSPEDAELFVVEGDSAGGSARQGRNPENQAILPLKGKILNVEKHRLDRILENNEIRALITAIGTGIGDEFDLEEARYKNIIVLTDADVDGAHIRTLLLTFLYRYMRPLLEAGYVYAAKPPLYRIKYNGNTYDAMTEAEREKIVEEKCNGNPSQVQRFKGLGEMNPDQLWTTTMNPENRHLKRLTVDDAAAADRMFSVLMGDAVEPRKDFIREHADDTEWVDI